MRGKPFAITLDVGSSLANKTGSWRTERPVYVSRLAPCGHACPAGEDVQGWLYRAEEGDLEGAWRVLVAANPFPAIMGRACFRPCESACNRAVLDEAVGINAVERLLGDLAIEEGWTVPAGASSGARVLVVGAGPAGLAAAYHLRRMGHGVEVREAADRPGGMLRYGIPAYRLPRRVVDAEIGRIADMGATLRGGTPVPSLGAAMAEGFDAAFVAVGAQRGRTGEIPAGDAPRVLEAITLLRDLEEGEAPALGRHVVIYGGGDTAMDAARSAARLGAADPLVVYRRTRDRMPAHDEELQDALAEGVRVRWLTTVNRAEHGRLVVERMTLDEHGFPQPTGEHDELSADALVLALGQDTDLSLLDDAGAVRITAGGIEVGPDQMTSVPGVFAGGDVVAGGERTITTAVGAGRRAASAIDAYLAGRPPPEPVTPALATVEQLNPWYYEDAPRMVRPRLEAARRRSTFDEVVAGLNRDDAVFEARRCLSCGNCFECDNCYAVCPDNAVVKLGPGQRYAFDLDYCKGCGICVEECPCGAIDLVPEPG